MNNFLMKFHLDCMNIHSIQNTGSNFVQSDSIGFWVVRSVFLCYTSHMKVIRNLEISAGEFFGVVLEELAAEIKSLSGAECTAADLHAGYVYIHNPDDVATKVVFEIVEYQEEKLYKAVRTAAEGDLTMIYDVVPNDKGITVSFTYENTTPAGKAKKGLFGAFSQIIFLSRMTDKLYDIQRTIINRREGFTEWKSGTPLFPNIRKSL